MSIAKPIDPPPVPFLVPVPSRGVGHEGSPCPALARKLDALRALPYFAGVGEAELQRLAEVALLRRFERGRTLARLGTRDDCVILVDGRAKTSIPRGTSCGEFALGIHEAGDIVSEGCWTPETATATGETVALEACSVLFLPRRALDAFLARNGVVALAFLSAIAAKLHRTMDLAAQNSCLEVGDRLYRRLVELSGSRGHAMPAGALRIEHGLHQSELAASIGASREAVNRQLAAWRDQGLVESGRRYVLVRDPLGLTMAVSRAVRGVGFSGTAAQTRVV